MPHNYEQFEVIQVAFPRNSPVLARLKEEAKRYTGRANAGPHIFELLADRDAHIYGSAEGQGKGIWFPPSYQVIVQIAQTPVQGEAQRVEQTDVVEEADATDIDLQAASMAAAFGNDDDDE